MGKMSADPVVNAKPILERFGLRGRTALVTGAAQGIGRAYAHGLGEAGAKVAIVDLTLAAAETVVAELAAKGIEAIAIQADVTKPDQVEAMVGVVLEKWGTLTIAVNNAGVAQWVAAEEMTPADWNRMIDVNLTGVFLGMQAEGRAMLKAGYGKIINTASISGTIVNRPQNQAHYNASKAGVIHLTRSFAAEWAARGVRVNSISPGYTRTKLVDDLLETPVGKEFEPQWMALTPSHHWVQVTDLQGAVVYLASEASDSVTGSDIIVDGGYTTW
jgi:NAD(P)-dependent dehydrogenase (short-subunit alcohol dehydrogenase family)